jgi:hypothetical protein
VLVLIAAACCAGAAPAPIAPASDVPPAAALADLTADDVAALRDAAAVLEELGADAMEQEDVRVQSLAALQRVHEALGDWSRPGLVEWYLGQIEKAEGGRLQAELIKGGIAAAKGGQFHLGGVHEFWRKVDAVAEARGKEPGPETERLRKSFGNVIANFEKRSHQPPSLRPLTLTVRKYNMAALLKPIEEPKPEKARK